MEPSLVGCFWNEAWRSTKASASKITNLSLTAGAHSLATLCVSMFFFFSFLTLHLVHFSKTNKVCSTKLLYYFTTMTRKTACSFSQFMTGISLSQTRVIVSIQNLLQTWSLWLIFCSCKNMSNMQPTLCPCVLLLWHLKHYASSERDILTRLCSQISEKEGGGSGEIMVCRKW